MSIDFIYPNKSSPTSFLRVSDSHGGVGASDDNSIVVLHVASVDAVVVGRVGLLDVQSGLVAQFSDNVSSSEEGPFKVFAVLGTWRELAWPRKNKKRRHDTQC